MTSSRFTTGLEMLQRVDGKGGEAVVNSLSDIAPDFARYLVEFPFGDIYARPGLDLRSREIATIAALTASGNAAPQLKVHIAAGLHVHGAGKVFEGGGCRVLTVCALVTALRRMRTFLEVFRRSASGSTPEIPPSARMPDYARAIERSGCATGPSNKQKLKVKSASGPRGNCASSY